MDKFVLFALVAILAGCESDPLDRPEACGGVSSEPLAVVAGGRARIELPEALAAEEVTIHSGDGIQAALDGSVITIRAGYDARETALELSCAEEAVTIPVTIEPLRIRPLLEWDPADGESPEGREYSAWWMDPQGARALYLYGGFVYWPQQFTPSFETWRLDLTSLVWSRVDTTGGAPPPGGRVAPGPNGSILYLGGMAFDASGPTTPSVLASVTVDGEAGAWAQAPFAQSAPASYTGAFVHDAPRGRWLSLCGLDAAFGPHCRVHEYTPEGGFVRLDVDGEPPAGRYGFHYAFDAETDRVIVFGGQTGPTDQDIAGDTWALELGGDRPRWVKLFDEAPGILPRRNGAYALDPEGHRLFVWGGTADGFTPTPGLDVLTLDRGSEAWTHVELPDDVRPRGSGAGLYDPAGHRILWGFGNTVGTIFTDLHALELAPDAAF